MARGLEQAALRTSVIYACVAALWILLSDRVLFAVVSDPTAFGRLATYKGWAFVSVTALLLYATLRRQLWRWEQENTQGQRADATVRESEDQYRTILETTGTATLIIEEDTRISLANTEFERLSGFSKEEIEGKESLGEFVLKDDLERMRKHLYARRNDPDSVSRNYEFGFLNRQGSVRNIFLTAALIPGTKKTVVSLLDITERKRAEEELRKSEQQMAILNQIANVFLTIPSEEMYGEVLAVVRKELKSPLGAFGFIEDNGDLVVPSMTREVWDQCQIPDKSIIFPSSTWVDSLWGKAIREKRPFSFAGPFQTPEGHVPIYNFLAVPIVFQNETIGQMSVANKEGGYTEEDQNLLQSIVFNIFPILHARLQRDRQERKRKYAEEQLRQLTQRQETLLGAIPDIVMEVDRNKVYTWANPAGYAFFGEGIIGKDGAKYLVGEQDTHPELESLFNGDSSPFYAESWQRRKDGLNRLLEWWCKALKDAEGRVTGALLTARDITDLRRTEEALRESEERYRLLVETASEAVLLRRGDGIIVYANPAALELLHAAKPEELVERNYLDFVHPDDREESARRIRRSLAQGWAAPRREHRLVALDGQVIEVESTGLALIYKGQRHLLGVFHDITERKKAEKEKVALQEQLQQAQKMEAIGTLAGGIAHDFNNILTAILGYAELASFNMPEDSDAHNNIQQSLKAAHRARHLVNQILAFSRQGQQARKPLDIRPIVKEGLKFLRASLPSTIEMRQSIEGELGVIEADPTQVHQVLMNLCTNAAHAMREGGGILEVSLTQFDQLPGLSSLYPGMGPGPYLKLRVTDTGNGIPAEVLPRIFDPYFTTKEVGEGTGLGLAVVHGIIKSYKGGVTVSSEPGKGTTFEIYIPRVETPKVPLPSDQKEPLPLGGRERILFVDDESAIAEIARSILEHLGYEVEVRTSSIEAREKFRANPDRFDLVITDMTMPNMTGDRLAQEILSIRPGMPIILCTGFSELITEEKAKALGIQEFIMKPLVMKDLAVVIRRALDRKKQAG